MRLKVLHEALEQHSTALPPPPPPGVHHFKRPRPAAALPCWHTAPRPPGASSSRDDVRQQLRGAGILPVLLKVLHEALEEGVAGRDRLAVGDEAAVPARARDGHVHAPVVAQEAHLARLVGADGRDDDGLLLAALGAGQGGDGPGFGGLRWVGLGCFQGSGRWFVWG